jgi:uncharacterized protein (TIGR00288 family)
MLKDQRVGVFVDAQNMYHSARNLYRAKVNFKEVLKAAVSGRVLVKAVAYVVTSDVPEEKAFFEALERSGFYLKMKELQVFAGGIKKGDWDVGMAIDAISMAEKLDVIVLVTGDGDFAPLAEYLKHKGVVVEIVAFGRSTSAKLIATADNFFNLEDSHEKYLIK